MKKLLVLSYYFPPMGGGGVLRTVDTVRLLEDHDWRSTVVAGPSDGYWVTDPGLQDRVPGGTRVLRVSAPGTGRRVADDSGPGDHGFRDEKMVRRVKRAARWLPVPDIHFLWAVRAARRALAEAHGAGLVLSTSPPESSHLAAMLVSARRRIPWVADFRDPWVRGLYRDSPTCAHRRFQGFLERLVLGRASLVLATTPATVDDFRARYPSLPPYRFRFVPNGFDPAEFGSFPRQAPEDPPLRLIHAGNLTLGRDPLPLLRAMSIVNGESGDANPAVTLELAGLCDRSVMEAAREMGVGDAVLYRGYLPRREVLQSLSRAHAGVLLESPAPGGELIVPGKLYDYFGARMPVLALVPDGAASELVSRTRCGVAVTGPDPARIAEELRAMLGCLEQGCPLAGPLELEIERFERPAIVSGLAGMLDELA